MSNGLGMCDPGNTMSNCVAKNPCLSETLDAAIRKLHDIDTLATVLGENLFEGVHVQKSDPLQEPDAMGILSQAYRVLELGCDLCNKFGSLIDEL